MTPYHEKYPAGSKVRIASREKLDAFYSSWKYHDKLTIEQLDYADRIAEVKTVDFYHGGDVLYNLKDVPGTWHEECLVNL